MRYDAFISYKHSPLDMEIAKKVHTGLETYRIPKGVKNKTGKKKMGRVFRDQEELPIGSDLGDNISMALAESEYLIVICSPRTPQSYWVCKEIDSFIKMHDRNHVLAVLIEGEPEDSFPKQLVTDDEGNSVEPLAADVRGATKKERNNKFKTEILRLAAPIIGCTYDELRQRHKERVIKRTMTIGAIAASVVAIAGTAFGVYNANVAEKMRQLADEKTRLADEITVQYTGKQENQSRFYAEESNKLLNSGNREDAILVAKEALPSEENERPYVAEAELALSKALYAYENGTGMTFERNLPHDLNVNDLKKSEDGTMLVSLDGGNNVYVWDTSNWTLKTKITPAINRANYFQNVADMDVDTDGVIIGYDNSLKKYDFDGNEIYSKELPEEIMKCEVLDQEKKIILVLYTRIYVMDSETGEMLWQSESDSDMPFSSDGKYCSQNGTFIAPHYSQDAPHGKMSVVDVKDFSMKEIYFTETTLLDLYVTDNNHYAVLSCVGDVLGNGIKDVVLDLIDMDGQILWTKDLGYDVANPLTSATIVKSRKYEDGGVEKNEIVLVVEKNGATFDENTGEELANIKYSQNVSVLAIYGNSPFGLVGYRDGGMEYYNFSKGEVTADNKIDTADTMKKAVFVNDVFAFNSFYSSDIHLLSFHAAPDLETMTEFPNRVLTAGISQEKGYIALEPSSTYNKIWFNDKDGNELYTFEEDDIFIKKILVADNGKTYLCDGDNIWIVDPLAKTQDVVSFKDLGLQFSYYYFNLSKSGKYLFAETLGEIVVIDIESRKTVFEAPKEKGILSAVFSNDEKKVCVLEGGSKLCIYDIESGEKKEFIDDELRAVNNMENKNFLTISSDDKYVAMCCRDGYVRVADTASLETYAEIPLQTQSRAFVAFTDDSTHLVMQGDDFKVRICNIETKSIESTVDNTTSVERIVCDEDSSLLAVCMGYHISLYETGSYGCVAKINDGLFYFSQDNSILLTSDGKELLRTYYKDYKTLLKEAEKQFPNAALDEEKKVKYNIS